MAATTPAPATAEPRTMSNPDQAQPSANVPARRESSSNAITTPEDFTSRLQRWQQAHYNVLTPAVTFSALPPQHAMIASQVVINPDTSAGEVYRDPMFCKDDEVAIAKNGLAKIAQAAGISWDTTRTDPRTIPNYWEVKAVATWRGLDGTVQQQTATVEYDLRDGSPRVRGFTPKQILSARAHGLRGAETRAVNAAIRGFGIKQKYTKAEVAKPFVVLRVAFQPDMSDPEQRRMVAERAMTGTSALYAPAGARHLPPVHEAIDADVVESSTAGASPSTPAAESTPPAASDAPPSEYSLKVAKVETKTGTKNGKPWTRWIVVFSNGAEYSTFSESIAQKAQEFAASQRWVDITTERNGQYENLEEIAPAQPALPVDEDGGKW